MVDQTFTLRTFLAIKTMERTGCTWVEAVEAVTSTVMEQYPEWALNERRTFPEWEAELDRRAT